MEAFKEDKSQEPTPKINGEREHSDVSSEDPNYYKVLNKIRYRRWQQKGITIAWTRKVDFIKVAPIR
jgi:hypothetical protein